MTDAARLGKVMPAVVDALHRLAGEQRLTNEDLMAALGFLAKVGQADEFVLLSDVLGVSRIVDDQTHAGEGGTASNVLGPFYREGAPWIDNPGSIVASDKPGVRITFLGTVTDALSAKPIGGAVLDVWQADTEGEYSSADSAGEQWHLRGRQRTDDDGRYQIETVQPKYYTVKHDGPVGRLLQAMGRHPWRPAHIHVMATADGFAPRVTLVYLAGSPYLDNDTIRGVKPDLVAPVIDGRIEFDIALAAHA